MRTRDVTIELREAQREAARLQGVNEELRKRSSLLAVIQGAGFWRRLWWVIAGVPHE